MYTKHRDSSSFREYQEHKKMKRLHPVNCADRSNSDLIDLNDMIKGIDAAGLAESVDAGPTSQTRKYHENCVAEPGAARTVRRSVVEEVNSSAKIKTGTVGPVKKSVRKPLPFQSNYLKSRVSKAKNRAVPILNKPKIPRYDNFLKSGMRSNGLKAKKLVSNATITKEQHLKQICEASGIDSDDENEVPTNDAHCSRASTPVTTQRVNHHKNYGFANDVVVMPDFLDASHSGDERSRELNNIQTTVDNPIRPTTTSSPQNDMSFEERVLKALSDVKKNQQSFEARIERRIETLCNDQSRTQVNRQSRNQGNGPCVHGQSRIQYQIRQYGGIRNDFRHRDPVSPERYADDFEDFEELDQNFPLRIKSNVEKLEFTIRKDLEFKFLLNSRLNELGALNYKKCIRLKMKYLFTDPVLERYSWNGTTNEDQPKSAFKQLKVLNNLLLHSVRNRCPDTKRDEYQNYMIQWLKHAKSRQRKVTYTYPERQDCDDSCDEDNDND